MFEGRITKKSLTVTEAHMLDDPTIKQIKRLSKAYSEFFTYVSSTWQGNRPVMLFRIVASGDLITVKSYLDFKRLANSYYMHGEVNLPED